MIPGKMFSGALLRRILSITANATKALLVASMVSASVAAETLDKKEGTMTEIEIIVDDSPVTAIVEDSAAARDFLSLLPLTLTLEDYHNTEKISDLPRRLSTAGAPAGIDPEVGDITYYAPWGNLAIFYRDFGYAKGLVRLGHITSGMDQLKRDGSFRVTIQLKDSQH